MQFETAQEMEEWRQRMMGPRTLHRNTPQRKKNRKKKSRPTLSDIVKKKLEELN